MTDQSPAQPTSTRPPRVKTPTVLQLQEVECGAAALGSILGYHGRHVPLRQLRLDCGVSRDGGTASHLVTAARRYGLEARGFRKSTAALRELPPPFVVFWNFNHFLVVEGFQGDRVFLNDPAAGRRTVGEAEFNRSYTGVVLTFERGPDFRPGGRPPRLGASLRRRLRGAESGLLLAVLIGLCLVLPGLALPALSKVFVDRVMITGERNLTGPVALGLLTAGVAAALLTLWQQRVIFRVWQAVTVAEAGRFFRHALRLPLDFFSFRLPGDVAVRALLNERVAQLLAGDLATNAINLVVVATYALVMLRFDVVLTVVGVGLALLNLVALRVVARTRTDASLRLQREQAKLSATGASGIQLIETLKATGSEPDFFARWAGQQTRALNARQELEVSTQYLLAVPPLLTALTTVAILAVGGLRVMEGALTIGALIAVQYLLAAFAQPLNGLVTFGGGVQEVAGSLRQLDDVLDEPADPILLRFEEREDAEPEAAQAPHRLTTLELRHVTFGYSRLDPPLIADLSLTLRPGARLALVGATGSGKTTLARLVTGLYEPWHGEVLFDGRPRTAYPRPVLTASLAAVDQEVYLFAGTVRDNLTLWDPTVPHERLVVACRDADIHDLIAARPGGYDGRVEEGGRNFSGGQRQRLEIARALAGEPSVLVLDEATSALDPVTEERVLANLRRRGCSCLIVAHRLSAIRDCDEIVVLEGGKVVQRGVHDELKAIDGPYARLIATE